METGYRIKFISTCRLENAAGYMGHVMNDAIEIPSPSNSCNRDGASC
jgi:hypothetical protein